MGWTTATTENANYVIELGWHTKSSETQEVDAFVVEGGEKILDLGLKQFETIAEKAKEKNKPIFVACDVGNGGYAGYYVDYPIRSTTGLAILIDVTLNKKNISRRKFFAKLGTTLFLVLPTSSLIASVSGNVSEKGKLQKREFFRKINAICNQLGISVTSLRSAFIAEQAEAIAKLLEQRIGRKPRIQITAGSGHGDIKEYLQNSELRRYYLKHFPFNSFWVANLEERKAIEIKFQEGTRKETEYRLKKSEEPRVSRREFFRRIIPKRKA